MTTTIFGTSRSRAFRVLWAAKEFDIPFEHEPIDWGTCSKDPDYLAINPAGSVPCLKEGAFVLAESLAINLYLAKKHSKLWPITEENQALALQWSLWAATSLEEPYVRWALNTCWLPKDLQNPKLAQLALEDLSRPLSRLDVALCEGQWLIEGQFTIADLNVASIISLMNGTTLLSWPSVNNWLTSCLQRKAFKEAAALP